MSKFLLNCDVVSSKASNFLNVGNQMRDIASTVASYDFSEADEFDFGGAASVISKNVENASDKIDNSAKLLNKVVDSHTSLQASMVFEANLNSNSSTSSIGGTYTIKKGDTLSKIASETGTTVSAIAAANNISNPNRIYAGDTISIPNSNNKVSTNSKEQKPSKDEIKKDNTNKKESNKAISSGNITGTNYNSNPSSGFNVTTDNKKYSLNDSEKELLVAIVGSESDGSKDDALAVASVILNRCEDSAWVNSYGTNPVKQATAPNQFVVYQEGIYKNKMNYNVSKDVIDAVNDALNGVRNNNYLSFRSNSSTSYSNNMITSSGNRYK